MKRNLKINLICILMMFVLLLFCIFSFSWYPRIDRSIVDNDNINEIARITNFVAPTYNSSEKLKRNFQHFVDRACIPTLYGWLGNDTLLYSRCDDGIISYNVLDSCSSANIPSLDEIYINEDNNFCNGQLYNQTLQQERKFWKPINFVLGQNAKVAEMVDYRQLFFNQEKIGIQNYDYPDIKISPDKKYAAILVTTDYYSEFNIGTGDLFVLECVK